MSDTDPLAGTTIGPDGTRVPVDDDGNAVESEKAIIEDENLTDPGASETAEDVGYGTVPDAVNTGEPLENPAAEKAEEEREASGSQADEQLGAGPTGGPNDGAETSQSAGTDANPDAGGDQS